MECIQINFHWGWIEIILLRARNIPSVILIFHCYWTGGTSQHIRLECLTFGWLERLPKTIFKKPDLLVLGWWFSSLSTSKVSSFSIILLKSLFVFFWNMLSSESCFHPPGFTLEKIRGEPSHTSPSSAKIPADAMHFATRVVSCHAGWGQPASCAINGSSISNFCFQKWLGQRQLMIDRGYFDIILGKWIFLNLNYLINER